MIFLFKNKLYDALFILIFILMVYLLTQLSKELIIFYKYIYNLLLPFFVGGIIAFIINIYVLKLRKRGVPKNISIIICFSVLIYLIIFIASNLVPIIINQINSLLENYPEILKNLDKYILKIQNKEEILKIGSDLINNLGKFGNLLLSPIISIYLINDYDKIKSKINNLDSNLKDFFIKTNLELTSYFQNVIIVALLMSLTSALLFTMIGLEYSLLLGIIVGLTNIIPFIGPYIGMGISGLYALSISPIKAIIVIIIIQALQFVESNFISPYLHSRVVKKSPLLILLSFMIFGSLFGIIGMILAVPILSIITNIIIYIKKYNKMKQL